MGEFRYIGLNALTSRGVEAVARATVESAEDLTAAAMEAETAVDTGTLKASIHPEPPKISGFSVTVKVATGAESDGYAIYVHEGTRPHIIRARNAQFLHFGNTFVKQVHHPGTAAIKYLERPLIENAAVYVEHIAAAARAAY